MQGAQKGLKMEKKEGKNLTTNSETQKIAEGPLDQEIKDKISTLFWEEPTTECGQRKLSVLGYIATFQIVVANIYAVVKLPRNLIKTNKSK